MCVLCGIRCPSYLGNGDYAGKCRSSDQISVDRWDFTYSCRVKTIWIIPSSDALNNLISVKLFENIWKFLVAFLSDTGHFKCSHFFFSFLTDTSWRRADIAPRCMKPENLPKLSNPIEISHLYSKCDYKIFNFARWMNGPIHECTQRPQMAPKSSRPSRTTRAKKKSRRKSLTLIFVFWSFSRARARIYFFCSRVAAAQSTRRI